MILKKLLLYSIAFTSISLLFTSCDDTEKEQLALKEKLVQVTKLEDSLRGILVSYEEYKQFHDSMTQVISSDTIMEDLPDFLRGRWQARQVVSESTCKEHVIGDTRQEVWHIPTDDTSHTITSYNVNQEVIRTYEMSYKDSILTLHYQSPNPESLNQNIKIVISDIRNNRMRGTRVNQLKDCSVSYTIELTRN